MKYQEHPSQPALKNHIQCFWTMSAAPHALGDRASHRVLPDGCIDIIFDFGDLRRRYPAYVVGTMSRPILVDVAGHVDMLGVRFRPGASQPFLQFQASECTDDAPDLECFWGRTGSEVWERLASLPNARSRIAYLESYLLKEFGWRLGLDPYVQYSVQLIKTRQGNVNMAALEKGTGLSSRQLERTFSRDIGLSPKAFARVVRFESLVRLAGKSATPDWTGLALESGYSDQSHLIRDFKAFSGLTPSEFFALQ